MADLTLRQAAAELGVDPGTLRVQAGKGVLRAKKVGPLWVVTQRELDRYRRRHLRPPRHPMS